jgi:hypothetical protein
VNVAAPVLQIVGRLCGLVLIALGIAFWTGNLLALVPVHMFTGVLLVVTLWVSSVVAAMSGERAGPVIGGFVWGAIVIALGMTQMSLLVGPTHWLVQVVHLLVGLGAIGLNERLTSSIKRRSTSAAHS